MCYVLDTAKMEGRARPQHEDLPLNERALADILRRCPA